MFGIDDIGLLLGALSLLEAVVHDITKVAGRIRSFTSYEEERLKLITKICSQRCLLNLAVSKLLAPLLRKDEIDALCEATSPFSWTNARLTTRLQQRYSQDLLAVFETARMAIARSSYKFLRSIGVGTTHGLDTAGLSPLHVLARARTDFDRGLGARLRYASHSKSIQEYFESIRDSNQDIHNAMSLIPDHVTQSRQASENWLQSVKQTRRSAIRLHEALKHHGVQCSHPSHRQTVYLELSSSGSWSAFKHGVVPNLGGAQSFDLLLEAQPQLMPARVLICSSNDVALPDNTANAPTATGACMLADSNVPAATTRLGFRANLDDAILSAIITQMEGLSTTHVAQPLQPVLPAHKATLLSLLPHRDKLSYPSRVIVASDLVDSLAHLAGSPWITPDVTQSDIAFFDGSGGMNPSPRNPTFTKAYLSRELHRPNSGQQLAEEYSSEYYQTIVLTMCIWLLGLCAASDHSRDIDTQQPLLAIMADAISWHEQLCKSETGVILEAALECLRLAMDSRLSFTDRDKDLDDFRVKVMEPLRMGDRAVPLVI